MESHYWDMSSGSKDSSYYEDLEVEREGKKLKILDRLIHVDDLWDEQIYSDIKQNDEFTVQFKNDSVYIETYSAGLGGGLRLIYAGAKVD